MKILWYGTAALQVVDGGTTLQFDPYLGFPRERAGLAARFRKADAVLVTHGHFDHIQHIPKLYAKGSVPVYATKTPRETLRKNGMPHERLHRIRPGEPFRIGSFRITAYPSRHCRSDLRLILRTAFSQATLRHPLHMLQLLATHRKYPENGEIVLYELEAGGKRLQVIGSLGLREDIRYPVGTDALVLAFQGRSDLEEKGLEIVERLKPKAVYLDHYDNAFPPMTSAVETKSFCELVQAKFRIPCEALRFRTAVRI